MESVSISRKGGRSENEDAVWSGGNETRSCFLAADGLGGHGGGRAAALLAVKAAEDIVDSEETGEALLRKFFARAQEYIHRAQEENCSPMKMRTTAVFLIVEAEMMRWGHAGDSRLYLFYHNRIRARTYDHSVPQALCQAHQIKEKEIRNHPDRNKLTAVLGGKEQIPYYVLSEAYPVKKAQAVLLCTDGFWEYVEEREMCGTLRKSRSPQEWVDAMEKLVLERGGEAEMDNYSAIAVWL